MKLLLSLSRLGVGGAGGLGGAWQVLPWDSLEASVSSSDRAADGTHLSADDILIYLSLTDGAVP